MHNVVHIDLVEMHQHVGDNWNNSQDKGNAKEDWQGIKVDAITIAIAPNPIIVFFLILKVYKLFSKINKSIE